MKKIYLMLFVATFALSAHALPPQVEADRLQLQAKSALDAEDYAQAAESLAKAEKLGVKLPDTFYFHYGRALAGTGDLDRAQSMLDRYLEHAGSKGKFYKEALVELNNIEAAQKQRAAEADRKASLIQRMSEIEPNIERYSRISDSEFLAHLAQYKSAWIAYDEQIIEPGIVRLKVLLQKRESLAAGNERDSIDAEIKQLHDDIAIVAGRKSSMMISLYRAFKEMKLKSDAHIMETIRAKSYVYSRCAGGEMTFDEAGNKVQRGLERYADEMSGW